VGVIPFAHPAFTDRRQNFTRPEFVAYGKRICLI
jgi:hypothetical protein